MSVTKVGRDSILKASSYIENNHKLLAIVKNVEQQGFLISAIRKPTVSSARLRITFNSSHRKQDIKKLVDILKKIL